MVVTQQLMRENCKYLHNIAETICIKGLNESVHLLGENIGPLKVGNTYKFYNFICQILVDEGYLDYSNDYIDLNTIQQINFEESTSPELKTKKEFIYFQALERMTSKKSREKSKINAEINDLITVRLPKIMRMAKMRQKIRAKGKLTQEEFILYNRLNDTITKWVDYVSKPKQSKKEY